MCSDSIGFLLKPRDHDIYSVLYYYSVTRVLGGMPCRRHYPSRDQYDFMVILYFNAYGYMSYEEYIISQEIKDLGNGWRSDKLDYDLRFFLFEIFC